MAELMGKEPEMLKERVLKLPGMDAARDEWNYFRDTSDAFAGERENWGFCASEVLYPDSQFFLGLNPSEPKGQRHERFDLRKLVEYGKIFTPLRLIADKLMMRYSYFDLFSVRRTKPGDLTRKLPQLLRTSEGRRAVAALMGLARQAIQTAQPKAIYVGNATVRDILRGERQNAKRLREAGIIPALFPDCPPVRPRRCDAGGKVWHFFYTVAPVDVQRMPVLLGIDLWNIKETTDTKDKIHEFIVSTLKDALAGPDTYYRTLPGNNRSYGARPFPLPAPFPGCNGQGVRLTICSWPTLRTATHAQWAGLPASNRRPGVPPLRAGWLTVHPEGRVPRRRPDGGKAAMKNP